MQSYHPFFPNYPPPPIPTRESIINEGLKTFEQSKTDQQWLTNWIGRKQEHKQTSSKQISLTDYRQKLIQHAHLLQQYEQALQNSHHEMLSELKIQIEQANQFIYNQHVIKNIQKQIQRRKSKRARLRRQKETKIIETKSDIIETINEKPLLEQIQDIQSVLHTIEQLKQLKTTRQQRQKENTIDNNDELTEIQNLCTTKLLAYQTELEKMSPSSHIELCNYLFNNHNQSFYESTNPDAQYFLRAHQNLHDLIQIRQTWDQYLTNHISSLDNMLPSKWHEPQFPCDSNWTQYIFNKKE